MPSGALGPRTHSFVHDRRGCRLGDHCFRAGLVGKSKPEAGVDLCFVLRVGFAQSVQRVAESADKVVDLLAGHARCRRLTCVEGGEGRVFGACAPTPPFPLSPTSPKRSPPYSPAAPAGL